MRIAVITQYFPTSEQPWAGHSAFQTLRILAARHAVRVFYPESRYPGLLTPKSRTHPPLDAAYQPDGIETRYLPYPVFPLVSRPLNGWMMSRKLLPQVQDYAPDIILSYVVYPDGYAAVRIGRKINVPVVLTAIGSDLNRISDPLCARHTRYALNAATWTTTVSADLLRTARLMGADPSRSTAILNGCDTAVFRPRDRRQARQSLQMPADADVILYVGRLDMRKGLAELVSAAASLRKARPKLRCYLVGDGPDRPQIADLVKEHDAQSLVHLLPPCPTERVALWMAASDVVTLPSYKEGCPNVVIEALASGRPVVASKVGGIPELMDESSGRLIPPQDAPALSSALDEVLAASWDPGQLASRHARSWTDAADDLEVILQRAVNHTADHTSNERTGPGPN